MNDKIMLNDEELNSVSGGSYEDVYGDFTKIRTTDRKEIDSIRYQKCPRCGLDIRMVGNLVFVCKKCRILWGIP